jgi:hypothetical protein
VAVGVTERILYMYVSPKYEQQRASHLYHNIYEELKLFKGILCYVKRLSGIMLIFSLSSCARLTYISRDRLI